MLITFVDRATILSILPSTGSFDTVVVSRDLHDKLKLSQKQLDSINFQAVTESGVSRQRWDEKKAKKLDGEIKFTERELKLIRQELQKLSKAGRLGVQMINTYQKFIETDK